MTERYRDHLDHDADNAHARVLRLVGERTNVLELGCASGYMSRALVERRGCRVTGVERDADAAEAARKACSRLIVADLETLDWSAELGGERFDVAVCADVLEHLRDPVALLHRLREHLGPSGYVVASIPNVAHAAVLAELLQGRFPYRPTGLLDETHLRFFTRESVFECFERAGFVVDHLERVQVEPEATEFRTDPARLPPEVWRAVRAGEESTTYQFVLTARPTRDGPGTAAIGAARAEGGLLPSARGGPLVEAAGDEAAYWRRRVEGLIDALLGRLGFLEADRDRRASELESQRAQLAYHLTHGRLLQDEIDRRDARAEALKEEIRLLEARLTEVTAHLAGVTAHLAEVKSGAGWRFLERVRRIRAATVPTGSWRERLYVRLVGSGRP
jgi:2-polyprenyl-3-methyl-5-hydroxy-6-metoxy-1,4-benzoquinol methylase